MKYWIICIFIPFIHLAQLSEQIILSTNWQFKNSVGQNWQTAKVPGNIYNDLIETKQIPDPYFSSNEKKVQWVDTCEWDYSTEFNINAAQLKKFDHAELTFKGLETFASIFLNDSLILNTTNAFRTWNKDILQLLRADKNTLRVHFFSTVKIAKAKAKQLPYTLPGDEKIFARAPQYKFGWDFGPRFVGCGITQPVTITFWKELNLKVVSVEQTSVTKNKAELKFNYHIHSTKQQQAKIEILNTNTGKKEILPITLLNGENNIDQAISIKDPQLWWCNGYGKPYLYSFIITIKLPNGQTISQTKKVGIRTIELIQKEDPFGTSFYFQLNGVPIFMKGANLIPPDIIKQNRKDHEFPLIAKNSNMNMLRVWGGGNYCSDEFYNACDEQGILVWQDLMFACAMYPGDDDFTTNVLNEVSEQINRIKDHPCLALWCGNNESDEGWKNWGWQKEFKYSKNDSSTIYNSYLNLFNSKIPEVIKKHSPTIAYWPSSPSIGWGHKESLLQGDSHYWGVWWGMEPFENYEIKFGRFMSEYGFQSLPSFHSLKKFCESDSLNKITSSIASHQKNTRGFETIETYLKREYQNPSSFQKYVYATQLVQRDGMKIAIETHRRNKPYCMGTLFWQLNDCWPGISWSSTDYFNEPKAFQHELNRLYRTLLISIHKERESYAIYLINDSIQSFKGKLSIQVKNLQNKILSTKTLTIETSANSSQIKYFLNEKELNGMNKNAIYLHCAFNSNDGEIKADQYYFFSKPKDLQLKQASIKMALSDDGKAITIWSDTFIKDLYLYSEHSSSIFKTNFLNIEAETNYMIPLKEKITDLKNIHYYTINTLSKDND
ncbi:MAG: beta-mannosidase [Sphingobacteriaceae bacterium]